MLWLAMASTNVRLNIPLVALAVAFGSCLQQVLWIATRLDINKPTNAPSRTNYTDEGVATFSFSSGNGENGDRKDNFKRLKNPPSEIYVLGERNSGTNYAAAVLRKAFDPPNEVDPTRTHEYFSSNIPILKHKHMFTHSLLNEEELAEISNRTDILWILAVRSPCEWAEAMKRLPWHMCYPNNITSECPRDKMIGFEHYEELKNYTLAEFFEMEWGDWPESSNFRNLSFVSKDFVYRNVFQLRRHKLMLMKQIIDTVPRNVKIVRLHELERSPKTFIKNLIKEFKLKLKKDARPLHPSDKIHTEKCLNEAEWEIAQKEIDWQVESYFGYTFLDCHLCYNRQGTARGK